MKGIMASISGFLLFLFCFLFVCWQILQGTRKYLEAPVATRIFSQKVDLPVLTICPNIYNRFRTTLGVSYNDFRRGQFMPDKGINGSSTPDHLFEEAINKRYYFLDMRGEIDKAKEVSVKIFKILS